MCAVLSRPKFAKKISPQDINDLKTAISDEAVFVAVTTSIQKSRDPNDNFILDLCIDGNADFLITGDADLLVLNPLGETTILTPKDFYSLFY